MTSRLRADRLVVERGLFESRVRAQEAIAAGLVTADGVVVRKASEKIAVDAALVAEPAHSWASRGGLKLAAALAHFGFEPAGRTCLDVGASTGGFTDVLVARGATCVYAVDVGHDQLHRRLRAQPQVRCLEGTDIRNLDRVALGEPPDLVTIDVSFVSVQKVLPAALAVVRRPAQLVALVKPQFEAGRRRLKKGIVRDEAVRREACDEVAASVAGLGWRVLGIIASPVPGRDGNREFLLGAAGD